MLNSYWVKRVIQPANEQTANVLDALHSKPIDRSIFMGIAFSLKNLWYDYTALTTKYIVKLLSYYNGALSQILAGMLNQRENLELIKETNALLDALIANKTSESLEELVPLAAHSTLSIAVSKPQQVAAIANQMINACDN